MVTAIVRSIRSVRERLWWLGFASMWWSISNADVQRETSIFAAVDSGVSIRARSRAQEYGLGGLAPMDGSTCPACGYAAAADARFCRQCGRPLPTYQALLATPSVAPGDRLSEAAEVERARRSHRRVWWVVGVVLIVAVAAGVAAGVVATRSNHDAVTDRGRVRLKATATRGATTTTVAPTFAALFANVSSGVVRIDATNCDGSSDVGSGFLLGDGLVATAAHVVSQASLITLSTNNGRSVGDVIGIDNSTDVALVEARTHLDGHIFSFASQRPPVGTPVAAIGFPEGLPITFTAGSVSALDRTITLDDGTERTGMIQTDTPVNPGNSGGPLLTTDGRVVGIVDALLQNAAGIGYAVDAQTAAPLLDGWKTPSRVQIARCGGTTPTPPNANTSSAVALMQQWATALATGDWATARSIEPSIASQSDAQLSAGYGGLKQATIVYVAGDPSFMTVASVAHEDVGSGQRTNVYCFNVAVDLTSNTMTVFSQTPATSQPLAGWLDPSTLGPTIATCAPSPG